MRPISPHYEGVIETVNDLSPRLHDEARNNVDEPRLFGALPLDPNAREELVTDAAPDDTHLPPSQALVVSDFDPPSISPGERLMRLAYKMGVPATTICSPFRRPLSMRLLATVDSPLHGDPVAGTALRAGHFLVHGLKTPIAQVDFAQVAKLTPPMERAVHGFTWLRDLAACAPRAQGAPTAERILRAWMEENAEAGRGAAWRVETAATRLLGWLVHAPLLLSGSDTALRGPLLAAIAETARWLDRNVGKADDRLGVMLGWCAITAAGLLLPEGKPRRLYGEKGLARALGELVSDDGGVLSRSPVAQMQAISALVELAACYRAVEEDAPHLVTGMLEMLVPPLLALQHSDGSLGNWQGAGAIGAERIEALIAASGVRARPSKVARHWGYQRVFARPAILQFDAAPPPLSRHARSGCASTLGFEFSHGDHRLITSCGGAAMAGGLVPVRIEQGLRATAAHSTMVLGDANSTAVLINGKLGSGVSEVEFDRRAISLEGGNATRLVASHNGYAARFGLIHSRVLILRDDGSELRGEDMLLPSGRGGKRGKVPFAIRFHCGRNVRLSVSGNGRGATLALPDGSFWQFVTGSEAGIELDESIWVDGEGRPHPTQQLVIQGMASRAGGSYAWLLKRMG